MTLMFLLYAVETLQQFFSDERNHSPTRIQSWLLEGLFLYCWHQNAIDPV